MGMFMLDGMSPWEFRVKQLLPFACNLLFHALTIPVDMLSVHSECLCFSAVLFRLNAFGSLCQIEHCYEAYSNADTKI